MVLVVVGIVKAVVLLPTHSPSQSRGGPSATSLPLLLRVEVTVVDTDTSLRANTSATPSANNTPSMLTVN